MFKFSTNMAIVMMAFFISCGQVEEPGNSKAVGGIYSLENSEPIKDAEQNLIKETCSLLKDKKRQMKSVANNNQNSFQFKAKKEECSSAGFDFNYAVTVRNTGNGFAFNPLAIGTFEGFREIIFDDYEGLNDFCIQADADSLSEREVINGKNLTSISASISSGNKLISLTYARKESGDLYRVSSNESFLIVNEYKGLYGLVVRRTTSDSLGCQSGSRKKFAELVGIDF